MEPHQLAEQGFFRLGKRHGGKSRVQPKHDVSHGFDFWVLWVWAEWPKPDCHPRVWQAGSLIPDHSCRLLCRNILKDFGRRPDMTSLLLLSDGVRWGRSWRWGCLDWNEAGAEIWSRLFHWQLWMHFIPNRSSVSMHVYDHWPWKSAHLQQCQSLGG